MFSWSMHCFCQDNSLKQTSTPFPPIPATKHWNPYDSNSAITLSTIVPDNTDYRGQGYIRKILQWRHRYCYMRQHFGSNLHCEEIEWGSIQKIAYIMQVHIPKFIDIIPLLKNNPRFTSTGSRRIFWRNSKWFYSQYNPFQNSNEVKRF